MNQLPLPTKTKIAAWAMIVIGTISSISLLLGIIFIIYSVLTRWYIALYELPIGAILLFPSSLLISPAILSGQANDFFRLFPYLFAAILFFLFGFFLLKRKKWVWWATLLFFIIEIFFVTYQLILTYPGQNTFISFNPPLYISGVLIILLVLDKNNYLKTLAKS